MARKVLFVLSLLSLLASCSDPTFAVHGDSTALGSREGWAKLFNFAPSWDSKRWWNIVASTYQPHRSAFNDGVGGQGIVAMREKMVADKDHRSVTTVIYDRRNAGEAPDVYIADLSEAVATLTTDHFLIMPQVPQVKSTPETEDQLAVMAGIDAAVLAKWPAQTFSAEERRVFLAALEAEDTRIDGLHRNARGQAIEAEYIGKWLHQRNW